MGANRAGWGAVKTVLNRLVAEGLIAAFRTSFRGSAPELGGHVAVTPGEPVTNGQADALRCRVETALAKRVPATVTADRSLDYNRQQI